MNSKQLKRIIVEELKKVLSEEKMVDICELDEKQSYYLAEGYKIVADPSLFLSKFENLDRNIYDINNWDVFHYLKFYAIYHRCQKSLGNIELVLRKICRDAQKKIPSSRDRTRKSSNRNVLYTNLDILIKVVDQNSIELAEIEAMKMKLLSISEVY